MKFKRALGATLLLAGALLLGGCSTASKTADIIADPDIKVGTQGSGDPSTVALSFFAERDVNENYLLEGTPIDFHLVYMKDDSKMLAGDFDQLMFELEASLGKNYLGHDDYTMIPGQYKYVEAVEVPEGTRYIGLIARFAEPNQTQWKKSTRIKSKGHQYNFLVQLRRANVDVIKEDY
ncbi:MAG: type VI secretion system lipoprotein TssJ [Pseudomonadales bacterium]